MKWCFRTPEAPPLLGVADSEGHITLHQWSDQDRQLEQIQSISCASSDTLCLSLDWSNRRTPTNDLASMIVSQSDGTLCLLKPQDRTGLTITNTWAAHDFEPWIAAWNYWDTNIIYSGGDDLKLKGWDIRQGFDQPTFINKRFDAGITTIQSNPHIEHVLAVGSYDDTIRVFDTRKMLAPLMQADVGGGAWRVKWHPSATRSADLLVACMHDGFKVVRFNLDGLLPDHEKSAGGARGWEWEIATRFDAHTSLAYGVDWSHAEEAGAETMVASCSFYDHTMRVWKA